MLTDAASELGIDLRESFMVGDKDSDVEAGRRAGCRTILLAHDGADGDQADCVARDWEDVIRFIAGVGAAR
jgi:D-glycero-D-manno-heptose 1,7-bisphosphate phosphatase